MSFIRWIKETFNCFTTRAWNMALRSLEFVPDRLKTEEICNKAVSINPPSLAYVTDHLKTQEICDEAVRTEPYSLKFVPDHLRQEICAMRQ